MYDKTYSELITLDTFDKRLEYLMLRGVPHASPRDISSSFYRSKVWRELRNSIIKRDLGCDLGYLWVYIHGPIYVHHINPVEEKDIVEMTPKLLDPENLITVSMDTHNTIHYREKEPEYVERSPNDTKLW